MKIKIIKQTPQISVKMPVFLATCCSVVQGDMVVIHWLIIDHHFPHSMAPLPPVEAREMEERMAVEEANWIEKRWVCLKNVNHLEVFIIIYISWCRVSRLCGLPGFDSQPHINK